MFQPLTILLVYIVLLSSVVFHEYFHAWMAKRLGDTSPLLQERLTLNPLPHIDIFGTVFFPLIMLILRSPILFGWAKPVPVNPYNLSNPKRDMIWIGLSGPFANFCLAFFFTLLLRIGIINPGSLAEAFISLVIFLNLILGTFNLIPIPPLDGSHILRGLLPYEIEARYMRIQVFMPFIFIFLILTGLLGALIWPIIRLWIVVFNVNFIGPAISLLR